MPRRQGEDGWADIPYHLPPNFFVGKTERPIKDRFVEHQWAIVPPTKWPNMFTRIKQVHGRLGQNTSSQCSPDGLRGGVKEAVYIGVNRPSLNEYDR